MAKTGNVSIVGGGIAGLAAALALTKTGHAVRIHEKVASFDHVGAGLQLGPNAVRALEKLGAWDAVAPYCYAPPAILIRDGRSGKLLKRVALGAAFEQRFRQPYRVAHRADLHAGLLAAVKTQAAIDLTMASAKTMADFSEDQPVVVADGIWSPSRAQMFPSAHVVRLEEQIFRALVDMPKAADADLPCVTLWLFPGGHVVHYPVRGGTKLNIVAVTPGMNPLGFFQGANHALRQILNLAPEFLAWPAAHVAGLPHWWKGNALLLGDAAHGTVPYLAQGAAMALEDAAALLETGMDGQRYQALRQARCLRLHAQSLSNGRIYHHTGLAAKARNLALAAMPERSFLDRLAWIYTETN